MIDNLGVLNDPAMVEKAFDDPEIRKLPLDSEEFNAALAETSKTDETGDAPAGEADEQDEADDTVDDQPETTDSPPAKRSGRKRDDRISALTYEIKELQRQLDQRKYAAEQETAQEPKSQEPRQKPRFADFETIEDYTEALTDWKLEVREAQAREAEQLATLKAQAETIRKTWTAKEAEVRKAHRDYDDVVNVTSLNATAPSTEARAFLGECDDGPRVVYELLSDSELAERFSAASPVKQVAILARIEAGLEPRQEAKKTIASRAPEPPRALPAGKSSPASLDVIQNAAEMSFEEWDRRVTQLQRAKKRA